MSQLRDVAPCVVELAEVRLTEHVAVCGVASGDKFESKHRKQWGLRIFFCDAYILFERDGEASEAVSFALVKGMKELAEVEGLGARREEMAREKKEREEVVALAEKLAKKEAAEAYAKQKAAEVEAKKANPSFAQMSEAELEAATAPEKDAKSDIAATPVPSSVDKQEMLKDMGRERGGDVSDEEQRSMEAAIARSKPRRK